MTPYIIPNFEHEWSHIESKHTYRGSFARHKAIEKILYRLRWLCIGYDGRWLFDRFNDLLSIPFGLNCNFPLKDIIKYATWELTKGFYDFVEVPQN